MRLLRLLLLALVAAAVPSVGVAATGAPPARLVLDDLPEAARVEVDGLPVPRAPAEVEVDPGAHLVTVFVPGRPPLEAFVELAPGETRRLRISGGETGPPAGLAEALLGSGTVAAATGALWWILADRAGAAAEAVPGRVDLPSDTRDALLRELEDREQIRRDVAIGATVAGALLLASGALVAWTGPDDTPPSLVVVPARGGVAAAVRVSF